MIRFLRSFERILDIPLRAFSMHLKGSDKEGNITLAIKVRWWHPATWCGLIRCRWLGDNFGSAIYGKGNGGPSQSRA